ncbi:MAG TPA: hypothetical protein VLM76_15435 [Patescibacteria group bacterium]|nr:hypothetical protein [Patescibacteria group bacterium]
MPAFRRPRRALVIALFAVALVSGACSAFTPQTPRPTATTFAGIVSELARVGVGVENVVAGDAGCDDRRLARTAISFDASGVDQGEPTRVYLYAFKNAAVFDELRPVVDLCARSYVTDPGAYASVEASPYVFAGPGPWAPEFEGALGDALGRAAVGG